MKNMNRKPINCPHCGKFLSEDFLNGVIKKKVKCPAFGSRKTWRNGKSGLPHWVGVSGIIAETAAKTFPINLDLWKVEPNPKPAYWSTTYFEKSQPIMACGIMSEAEALVKKAVAPSQTTIKAAGRFFEGKVVFDINIFSFFVKSVGSVPPACQELLSWLFKPDVEEYTTALLSFEGS